MGVVRPPAENFDRYVQSLPVPNFGLPSNQRVTFEIALNGLQWVSAYNLARGAGYFTTYTATDVWIQRIYPPASTVLGSTDFAITGAGFITGATLVTRFRNVALLPCNQTGADPTNCGQSASAAAQTEMILCTFTDFQLASCTTPAFPAAIVVIDLSINGGEEFPSQLAVNRFVFYPLPSLTKVTPSKGPAAGNTTILVSGRQFFVPPPEIQQYLAGSGSVNLITCLWLQEGYFATAILSDQQKRNWLRPGTWVDPNTISCMTPALDFQLRYVCLLPLACYSSLLQTGGVCS